MVMKELPEGKQGCIINKSRSEIKQYMFKAYITLLYNFHSQFRMPLELGVLVAAFETVSSSEFICTAHHEKPCIPNRYLKVLNKTCTQCIIALCCIPTILLTWIIPTKCSEFCHSD